MAAMSRQHVAIVGAGPAGLLLAISLLEPYFCERFRVVVYEARGRGDVHTPERGWAMPLGVRGRAAIQSVDGGQLWAAVAPLCAHVSRIVEHAADGTVASRALAAPLAVISRAALVDALLAKLEERVQALRNAGHNPMVHVRFDTKVVGVELDSRVLRIITPESPGGRTGVAYDLLVGADGMSSTVRDALASRPGCNFKQEWLSSCSKFVAVPAADLGAFDVEALHLFPRAGVNLEPKPAAAVVPAPSEMLSVSSRGPLALVSTALSSPRETLHAVGAAASALVAPADAVVSAMPIATGAIVSVSWSTDAPPVDLTQLDSPQEAQRWMQRYCPALAPAFTDAVAATFAAQRTSYARAISMNKYFDSVTRAVVLMGDAAHAAAPAAGQSAAAALGDAVLLAQLLHTNADVRAAAEAYNAAAVPQGHAVVQLSSALPMLMPLSFVPLLRVVDRGREALCDKLASSQRVVAAPPGPGAWTAPLLSRSVLELLFDSEEPFTDVLRRHRPYVAAMMFVNRFRDGAIF